MLLAGDIGGTKTDLAIFSAEKGPRAPLAQKRFASADYPGLEAMAREFLAQAKLPINEACFGVAGPVVGGRARLTNLPWLLDEDALREALKVRSVRLMNDLEAIANAVPELLPGELHTLNAGRPADGGAVAVIAPGTGLGEAFLTWDGANSHAHASEGGHADFAPANEEEIELLRYLQSRFDHVSYERVCSGSGIPNLYDFLISRNAEPEAPNLAARLAAAEDRTPIIVDAALNDQCSRCKSVLQLFVSILGAEAGNLALKVLATGGVYLGGGIPPRILPALTDGRFMESFRRKGRFEQLMTNMPVHVITTRVALIGIARFGLRRDKNSQGIVSSSLPNGGSS